MRDERNQQESGLVDTLAKDPAEFIPTISYRGVPCGTPQRLAAADLKERYLSGPMVDKLFARSLHVALSV